MSRWLSALNRLAPALLIAAGVTLLAAGLLSYGAPDRGNGSGGVAGTTAVTSPGPSDGGPAAGGQATPSPPATDPPNGSPGTSSSPGYSASEASPSPSARPGASSTPEPDASVATRLVIPSLGVDLPIVSRDLRVPGQGPDQYPPCDVAVYHTAFVQPGQPGSTYLYAHARPGMFLPLLDASLRADGAGLLGDLVQVYTDDDLEYIYQITTVKRHATDFAIADELPPGASGLVLQTSEGPTGTVPKLQVQARPIEVFGVSRAEAHPRARPRACFNTP